MTTALPLPPWEETPAESAAWDRMFWDREYDTDGEDWNDE